MIFSSFNAERSDLIWWQHDSIFLSDVFVDPRMAPSPRCCFQLTNHSLVLLFFFGASLAMNPENETPVCTLCFYFFFEDNSLLLLFSQALGQVTLPPWTSSRPFSKFLTWVKRVLEWSFYFLRKLKRGICFRNLGNTKKSQQRLTETFTKHYCFGSAPTRGGAHGCNFIDAFDLD